MEFTDLDRFETKILETTRLFTLSFTMPETQAWIEAFGRAEQAFPAPYGATIAHAVLIAITEVRSARCRGFLFNNPHCPNCSRHLTSEERYFMETLRAVRLGQKSRATACALMLCENEDTTGVLAALERLSMITGDVRVPAYV